MKLPYGPAIPLLVIYPEKALIPKDTCTPKFIAALLTIARIWKQPKCPSTDDTCIHTQNVVNTTTKVVNTP